MTRTRLVPFIVFIAAIAVISSVARAEMPTKLVCSWKASPPSVDCPKLTDLDASHDFVIEMKAGPSSLQVAYSERPDSPTAPTKIDCQLTEAAYTCPKRTVTGTGIHFFVAGVDVLNGSTKASTAEAVVTPAATPTIPLQPHWAVYDSKAHNKVADALVPGQAKLADGDGYSFNYTSSGQVLIVVNALAQPLRPIPDVIDETDEIVVAVVDRRAYMSDVTLSVSGCNRPPVDVRVFGATPAPQAESVRDATDNELDAPVIKLVGRCAGADVGGPTITVKTNTGKANETSNTVTIPVNPVYRFTVGVGLGVDLTKTQAFGVATVPGATVATITETDDRIGLASLIFVGWYPWGRDFRKTAFSYALQRVEGFVALDPKAIDQSLTIGGGINLVTGMDLLVGWRALNKTIELQPGAGLRTGSNFDGPASSLPTAKVWSTGGLFVGLGITNALLAKLH